MWNYSLVVPSLFIMLTLLAFYFARRRLPLRINRTFLAVLALQMWVIVFDLISSRADEEYARFTPEMLYVLNTVFFVLYIARIYWFYLFTLDILGTRRRPLLDQLASLPFYAGELLCITSFWSGAVFRIQDGMYQRGPLYDVLYACSFFYCGLSLALLLVHAKRLKGHSLAEGIAYNVVLLAGNVVRILFPQYLVMNTFCMVAILIIYLAYLNPDLYITERGPAFNMRGFRALLAEIYQRRKYRILGFALQNYNHERSMLGGEQMDEGIIQINRYLARAFPSLLPFYLRSGRFALVGKDSAPWEDIQRQIHERFQQPWHTGKATLYLGAMFASVNPGTNLSSSDRVVNNLVLALENERQSPGFGSDESTASIQEVDQQVDILHSLELALERNQVEVFLQPVVDSRTRRIAAAEALARIRDDAGRIIPPGLFIPIAEKSGYINQLGEQVFERTCEFIRSHDIGAMGLGWINVNISPIQCMQPDLAQRFDAILKRFGVRPETIHLEITEQSMIDYSMLQKQIQSLQGSGFQFVLDDYGSGYSNLTRVKHYPFVNIKLDMEVVWDYFNDRDSLLPTIIEGFRKMNLSITAEGIETPEMADVLTEIGSDYLQGFLFSKPLPLDEFAKKYGGASPT